MARRLRFIPPEGALVEITCRTVQARFLLTPSVALNEIILGVLGRAQRLYPVGICAYVFLSNHFHLLLKVHDAQELSDFMGYFNSNLAREVARQTGWNDKIWARRYQAIPISAEEGAQVARLRRCGRRHPKTKTFSILLGFLLDSAGTFFLETILSRGPGARGRNGPEAGLQEKR